MPFFYFRFFNSATKESVSFSLYSLLRKMIFFCFSSLVLSSNPINETTLNSNS